MTSRIRHGNAVVMVLAVLGTVAAIVAVTVESAVSEQRKVTTAVSKNDLDAAVQATLHRRSLLIQQALAAGPEGVARRFDPAVDWAPEFRGRQNYGVDYIGNAMVRWAIEPVRTRQSAWEPTEPDGEQRQDADGASVTTPIPWIQNPKPDPSTPLLPGELANDTVYLFKISAEARSSASSSQVIKSQGVRYISANKEPLFRYIIFYASEGPKGDLDFIHQGTLSARGSVHSNGAVYIGGEQAVGGTKTWAINRASSSVTEIGPGPNNEPIRFTGFDGIWRMSKMANIAMVNGFNFIPYPTVNSGWYDTNGLAEGESGAARHYPAPLSGTLYQATHDGTVINPYRISGHQDYNLIATLDAADNQRIVNKGISSESTIRGVDFPGNRGNDSRDRGRTGYVWATDSLQSPPTGYSRSVRDRRNGGRIIALPDIMKSRPLEAQAVSYVDMDGDPNTDEHDFAQPVFALGDGQTTTVMPVSGEVVEQPGAYLGYALGTGNYMKRISDVNGVISDDAATLASNGHNGWAISSADGSAPVTPDVMGFIVRERAMPHAGYMTPSQGSLDSPTSVPYAYGKHHRTSRWPFHVVDVSPAMGSRRDIHQDDNDSAPLHVYLKRGNDAQGIGTFGDLETYGIDPVESRHAYTEGGSLSADVITGAPLSDFERSSIGYASTEPAGSIAPRYHRGIPSRLYHVQRMVPDESSSGALLASLFRDIVPTSSTQAVWRSSFGPFSGTPVTMLTTASGWPSNPLSWNGTSDYAGWSGVPLTVLGNDWFSIRMTGFLKPSSDTHRFRIKGDDGFRLWVNDTLVVDRWIDQGMNKDYAVSLPLALPSETWVPLRLEYFEMNGGSGLHVEWSIDGVTWETIPLNRLCPPADRTGSAGLLPVQGTGAWTSITARISPGSGGTTRRYGIGVFPIARETGGSPESQGVPQLLDGKDPNISFWFNPNRGVFVEYRGRKASSVRVPTDAWFVGRDPGLPPNAIGNVVTDPSSMVRSPHGVLSPTRVLAPTTQLIADGNPPSAASLNNNNLSIPRVISNTTDAKTWNRSMGVGSFAFTSSASQKWRYATFSRWNFNLSSPDLTYDESFRWTNQDAFQTSDLSSGKRLRMFLTSAIGSPLLRWTTTSTSLEMLSQTLAGGPNGGIAWNETSSPRIIWTDKSVSATMSMGRSFTVQWVTTSAERTISWMKQNIAAYNAMVPTIMGANLVGSNIEHLRVERNSVGQVSLVSNGPLYPSAVIPTIQSNVDSFGRSTVVAWNYTIGSANTVWYDENNRPLLNTASQDANGFKNLILSGTIAETDLPTGTQIIIVRNRDALRGPVPTSSMIEDPNAASLMATVSPPSGVDDWLSVNATSFPNGLADAQQARTFALTRGLNIIFDVNSLVTAWGRWMPSAASQIMPWHPVRWGGLVGSTAIPKTFSYRPDWWYGTSDPTRSGIDGATTTSTRRSEVSGSRLVSDQPSTLPSAMPSVWLRINRSGTSMTCQYAFSESQPLPSQWVSVTNESGSVATFPILPEWEQAVMGPMIAGQSTSVRADGVFDNISVTFSANQASSAMASVADPKDVLDARDWDGVSSGSVTDMDRYLMSQYQVFFGPYDITEDAITWRTASGARIINEDWIYSLREFWSQPRWWDDGTEKDSVNMPTGMGSLSTRERLARTTLLTLDAEAMQAYIASRSMFDAVADRIPGSGPTVPTGVSGSMKPKFNGLVYMARTNRYPWNPNIAGPNPWNPLLPNDTTSMTRPGGVSSTSDWLDGDPADRMAEYANLLDACIDVNMTDLSRSASVSNTARDQVLRTMLHPFVAGHPSGYIRSPAIRSQQWHHAVRIVNGSDISWGFSGASAPPFGTGKTSFVTSNPLYVQGNFNTVRKSVSKNGALPSLEIVPVSIMCDDLHLLSGSWNDALMKNPGMSFESNGQLPSSAMHQAKSSLRLSAVGTNANPGAGQWGALPSASNTTMNAAIVTNNIPTSKESVAIAEAANIASLISLSEVWDGSTFAYSGSIVVLDSKRYSQAFMLGYEKPLGPSPFGYMNGWSGANWVSNSTVGDMSAWWSAYGHQKPSSSLVWPAPTSGPSGRFIPQLYGSPTRTWSFNPDLLSPEGTPPYAPFGVTVSGIGGWLK